MMAIDMPPPPPSSKNPRLDLDNLRALWGFATTHRERARLEAEMWRIAAPDLPASERSHGFVEWLRGFLQDAARGHVKARSALHNRGHEVDALWARVDGEERMLVKTAGDIMSRAKLRAASELVSLVEAIDSELVEYDTWLLRVTPEGTFRKRPQRPKGFARTDELRAKGRKSRAGIDVAAARENWGAVRASVKRAIDHELRDIANASTKERLRSQAEAEIDSLVQMLRARVSRAAQSAHLDAPIVVDKSAEYRRILDRACQSLSVDAPERGKRVDMLLYMTAKKNFKKLVREYHPDQGGNAEQYDMIVKAMRAIEEDYQAADNDTKTNGDERT